MYGVNCWQVQVLHGADDVAADGPVRFGTTTVQVSPDGEFSQPYEPLVLAPVGLRSYGSGHLQIVTWHGAGWKIHREMWQVVEVEFNGGPEIRIEGMEIREDGAVVAAAWEVSPCMPEAE